jgi:glycosidase
MTMPGIPCIYYGSEWGIEGRKNWNDTDLRPYVEKLQRNELTDWISKLIQMKHKHPALQNASYAQVALNNTHAIYERSEGSERLWAAVNISKDPVEIRVNHHGKGIDLLTGKEENIDHSVKMNGYEFKLIQIQ